MRYSFRVLAGSQRLPYVTRVRIRGQLCRAARCRAGQFFCGVKVIRVISANLNGVRSAAKKGFFDWLEKQQADFVCVQELKAQQADMDARLCAPAALHGCFHFAMRRGYSGVGIYTRHAPDEVRTGFGVAEFDDEGRYVEVRRGALSVVSVYVPSGSSGEERQAAKYRFMDAFFEHLRALRSQGREIVVCGDWNIAHREIDLKNWKSNQKNSGFLPEERAWFGRVLDELGWVDVFRRLYPEEGEGGYTWWSNRGQAWAKNVGWRLDYQLATPQLAAQARAAAVYRDERFSDHAPLTVDYDYAPHGG